MPPKKSSQPLASVAAANMTRHIDSPIRRLLGRLPFIDWYVARRERTYAESQCRSLLEIYEHLRREDPELGSDRLYARVVEHSIGCDPTVARSIVLEADRSFAQWPTEREVTFRDVVVFLLLNQLLPADSKTLGVQANVTAIVAKAIPLRL